MAVCWWMVAVRWQVAVRRQWVAAVTVMVVVVAVFMSVRMLRRAVRWRMVRRRCMHISPVRLQQPINGRLIAGLRRRRLAQTHPEVQACCAGGKR